MGQQTNSFFSTILDVKRNTDYHLILSPYLLTYPTQVFFCPVRGFICGVTAAPIVYVLVYTVLVYYGKRLFNPFCLHTWRLSEVLMSGYRPSWYGMEKEIMVSPIPIQVCHLWMSRLFRKNRLFRWMTEQAEYCNKGRLVRG